MLGWNVVAAKLAMSVLALSGSASLLLRERLFSRTAMPLWRWPARALHGWPLFHMLPESIAMIGNRLSVYAWVAAGVFRFHVREQSLH
ncbi:MAG TPA: hypothetical protein VMU34_04840 [Mycobacterium sp.]|nr:hypothetical protein [Mycobacterium sp.]